MFSKDSFGRERKQGERKVDRARWIENVGLVNRDREVEFGEHVWH